MSVVDDLKERITSLFNQTKESIQESSAYNQAMDRFQNLTPPQQNLTLIGSALFTLLIILYFPFSSWLVSTDNVVDFEAKRGLIRELLQTTKEASEAPMIPPAPPVSQLRSIIDGQIKAAHLLPEQIKGIDIVEPNSKLIPKSLSEGAIKIQLSKLNLRQIVSIGSRFQSVSPSVKVKDLMIEANREDNRYFDLIMTFIALKVPSILAPALESTPSRENNRGKNRKTPTPSEETE